VRTAPTSPSSPATPSTSPAPDGQHLPPHPQAFPFTTDHVKAALDTPCEGPASTSAARDSRLQLPCPGMVGGGWHHSDKVRSPVCSAQALHFEMGEIA